MGRGAVGVFVVVAAAGHKVEPSQCLFIRTGWLLGGGHQMAQKINAVRWRPSLCFLPLIYRHALEWSAGRRIESETTSRSSTTTGASLRRAHSSSISQGSRLAQKWAWGLGNWAGCTARRGGRGLVESGRERRGEERRGGGRRGEEMATTTRERESEEGRGVGGGDNG